MDRFPISSQHPVLSFAAEEWSRLLRVAGKSKDTRLAMGWIGTWEELKEAKPSWLEEDGFVWEDTGFSDEFFIRETEDQLVLSGKSERAALYAVYQYAREAWGLHAIYPGTTPSIFAMDPSPQHQTAIVPKPGIQRIRRYAPRMERRGFVVETINDPPYLKQLLDWFAHNRINEIFFTFTLWDQVGAELAPEIVKRGIQVTLGGHSIKFFLNHQKGQDPQAQADHPYTAKAQLDFRDIGWQLPMVQQITEYCRHVPNLTRISLWPEDIADRQTEHFLANYLQFTERLNACMQAFELDIAVEHIAYNAGLAWNMLELGETRPSGAADTLFAFWGRDYRYGYEDHPRDGERRAGAAIEQWSCELEQTGRKLTIFEYYSDHYMLSNLFPFLPHRIMDDVAYYEQRNVLGIVNLIVPYRGPDSYPWKWVHGFNSYVFCRALWSDDLVEILNDYYSCYPERMRPAVRALFEMIEAKLSVLTSWNIPLFPARAVDPEKAAASKEQREVILATLAEIGSSIQALQQLQEAFASEQEPYRYARHIVEYSEKLYQRWLEP